MSLERGICVGWAKVIDFHLKGSTVGLKCINNITGRSPQKMGLWITPTNLALERFSGSTITGGNQASWFNILKSYRNILDGLKTEDL